MLDEKHLSAFRRFVGSNGSTEDPDEIAPYVEDWRGRYRGKTPIVLKPNSRDKVSQIIDYCSWAGIAVVPQGGNTGLVKGGIPSQTGEEVLLTTKYLLGDIIVDTDNNTITAHAGTPIQLLHDAAKEHDRTFGLSLASQGSCTVGGVVSTNAGGINVLRYGMTRDLVVGLEAVLPNGDIFSDLSGLKKDNTGYNLRDLFIGAEGTLGIVTKVMFKLFPAIYEKQVLMVAMPDVETAVTILNQAHALGDGTLNAFEVMPKVTLEMVAAHNADLQKPFEFEHPWYAIIEFARSTPDSRFTERLKQWLEIMKKETFWSLLMEMRYAV